MKFEFEDEDLRRLYEEPDFKLPRMGTDLVSMFRRKMQFISSASSILDLYSYRALRFEKLKGDRVGQHSIRLNDQWRLIVRVEEDPDGQSLLIIEIVDYH